jgi:DNA-binding NarL/FixJ family response regulator
LKKGKRLNILIIDDHQIVRNGLKSMLKRLDIMYDIYVYEAYNLKSAVHRVKTKNIHFVFIDYNLDEATALDVLPVLFRLKKDIKAVAISNYDELVFVNYMIQCGASGYLIKNITTQQLKDCILMVMNNQNYFSSEILIKMLKKDNESIQLNISLKNNLSSREIEILQLISLEFTNTEIAEKLFLAKRTVDTHRQNLLVKLNVKNTVGLVRYAIKHNLI